MDFVVKHGEFEGPLHLLLQLVEKRKMFINDISLSSVTDDYLAHINQISVDIDQKTEFLVIAAVLVLLKTRSLLPNLELTDDEKSSVSDLEHRLAIFQIFVNGADALRAFIKQGFALRLPKKRKKLKPIVFVPSDLINPTSMQAEVLNVLNRQPKVEQKPHVTLQKVLTLEEVIDSLQERIQKATRFTFNSLVNKNSANTKEAKVNIIVSFLAMLELVRQGILSVTQNEVFDDISIERPYPSQPNQVN